MSRCEARGCAHRMFTPDALGPSGPPVVAAWEWEPHRSRAAPLSLRKNDPLEGREEPKDEESADLGRMAQLTRPLHSVPMGTDTAVLAGRKRWPHNAPQHRLALVQSASWHYSVGYGLRSTLARNIGH